LAKLHSEEAHRDRLKKLFAEGVAAGKNYRESEMAVQARLAEVANAELTLRTWRMNDEDMNLIRSEAERLAQSKSPAVELKNWARVEIRAPMSGVVLEKNITVGDIVEPGRDLFKICETSHLMVWAHVYEEDLQLLESLPRPIRWNVRVSSRSGDHADFPGTLDRIGAVIDQSQHTALVTGRVDNTSGDLKIGQFVTVTLELPPRPNEIELPATAIVEDGRQSIVFVQPTPDEDRFVRQSVHVVRRTRDKIYIKLDDKLMAPGSTIVTAGAMMIQNAMDQLPISDKYTHLANVSHSVSTNSVETHSVELIK
jgi:cobalt-zinc-cadmium efflux system membrane fusion protein